MNKIVLAISGSLRRGSYSTRLLSTFGKYAPKDVDFRVADISRLPLFNQDLELPEPDFLSEFKMQIKPAHGILLVTPEYNRSIPPVLKNALDWASRPAGQNVWSGKAAAIAGCSPFGLGAFGAVHHLRQVLTFLNMPALQQPEFYLSGAAGKFDEHGTLIDEGTINRVNSFWAAFSRFIDALSA